MNGVQSHNLTREGLLTGAVGATVIAAWFLLLDTLQGRPFHTPGVLGASLFSILGPPFSESNSIRLIGYTVFHYAVFFAVGILLVFLIHRSRRQPAILAGLLIAFVVSGMAVYFFAALLSEPGLMGDIGWYQFAIGNLLAGTAMGAWLWRTHPMLSHDFAHALSGEE